MREIIDKYLKSKFGDIDIPSDNAEKQQLARALFGLSIVENLDYWLNLANDYVDNEKPDEPFARENAFSQRDKHFRNALAKLDNDTKKVIKELICSTSTGIIFSLLTNLDQFDYGKLKLSLTPKSRQNLEIEISSEDELHDDLAVWIDSFSKYKDDLVEKENTSLGTSYRLL